MRIIIISAAYPLRGGIAHFAGSLFKELSTEHDVKVFTFRRQYPSLLFPGKSQTEPGDMIDIIPTEVMIDSINPFNWLMTARNILKEKPDLVIFKYWLPFFAPCYWTIARKIKKTSSIKLLAICHNIIPHEKRPGDKILSQYFLREMDYFILLSAKVQEDLRNLVRNARSAVLPHPVYSMFGEEIPKDEARKKLSLPPGRYILFFGFIRDYKGLDTLIRSMSMISSDYKIKLLIAGEFYSDESVYTDLIGKLSLEETIILKKDFIPTSEVKYYFSASDLVILPYKSATQSGIVQIAVNFSRPVIATDVGGIAEVIRDGESGFIVEKENPDALAKAITRFYIENKEVLFTEGIKKIKQKYSWQNFTQGIFDLISK